MSGTSERLQRRLLLWDVLRELSRVAAVPAEAESLRAEARALVERIGESIEHDELRAGFIARPDVKELG